MRILSRLVVFLLLLAIPIQAYSEINIRPRLNISETYTDNVRLGGGFGGGFGSGFGGGAKKSDLITSINPSLFIDGKGQRFDLQAAYTMNNIIYARNSNLNRIWHGLHARGEVELFKEMLFVDGFASIRQQNANLFGPQTDDNIFATGNRSTFQTYSVSPYLRHQFQNFASAEIRYTKGFVKSGFNGLRDSQRDGYQFNLNSGSAFTKLAWGISYSNQQIHMTRTGRDIELENSVASLRYLLTRRFSLTASGGYERNSFLSIRGRNSSPRWTTGFIWTPNRRTNLEFRAGQRFFGDTYYGSFYYNHRLLNFRVLYEEDITTFNQQAGGFNAFGAIDFNGFAFNDAGLLLSLNNFLTNRVFLQKRFNASLVLTGNRNTMSINLFNMTRTPYTSALDDVDLVGINNLLFFNHTKQMGGNINWDYKFSPRTTLNATASYLSFNFANSNGKNDNLILSSGINRDFGSDLRGSLIYRRIERLSHAQLGNGITDFSANVITLSLSKNF